MGVKRRTYRRLEKPNSSWAEEHGQEGAQPKHTLWLCCWERVQSLSYSLERSTTPGPGTSPWLRDPSPLYRPLASALCVSEALPQLYAWVFLRVRSVALSHVLNSTTDVVGWTMAPQDLHFPIPLGVMCSIFAFTRSGPLGRNRRSAWQTLGRAASSV